MPSCKRAFRGHEFVLLNRQKSIFFENNVRFACVCAFFVVPLHPI